MADLNLNDVTFDKNWRIMKPIMLKVLRQKAVKRGEWQDLFLLVHSTCIWAENGPSVLLKNVEKCILQFTRQTHAKILRHQEDQALLKAYIAEWTKFYTQCDYFPLPLSQLELTMPSNTSTIKRWRKNGPIWKLLLKSWNDSIFSDIKHTLQNSAMRLVRAERSGEAFDSQLVIGVRESYVNLGSITEDKLKIYRDNFEKAYMDATLVFYKEKASEYLEANGIESYMQYADQKLKDEDQRAVKYLYSCSLTLSTQNSIKGLVTEYKDIILAECLRMIKNHETEKLQLMFRLIDKVENGIDPMLKDLEGYIVNEGLADMMAAADIITQDSEKYVARLLELFRRFSKLVKEAFIDDPRFLASRDKAFKKIVNDISVFRLELPTKKRAGKTEPESRCPELLANYCDMLLRKTPLSKKLTLDEIEGKLKDVIVILKYVQNKDVFMRYHKSHLTRRLILETSADNEKEENLVNSLRDIGMPADYVNKLSRMFQDIKVNEDLKEKFKRTYRTENSLADFVKIKILNTGAWARASERIPVSLPLELEDFIPEVEEFYKQKYSGRKLQWYHHMSNGTITFSNAVGKFDLEVTTFQMGILFAWNQRPHEKITFENLRLATELPDTELRRNLWSLVAFPKLKQQVLLYSPEVKMPKDFDDSTVFWINQKFAIIKNNKPQKRGKINLIGRLQLSTEKNKQEDNECIVHLRILRTQEAIVKIMKMRKSMTNAQLQTELVEILKNLFLPSRKMIKEQTEWLIEHKYMKRDDDDIRIFHYIA